VTGFSPRRAPRQKAEKGRVIALYGAPGAGSSTIARIIKEASKKYVVIIPWELDDELTTDDLLGAINTARGRGADVVLIDAVCDESDVKALVEGGLVDNFSQGKIVHVQNMDAEARQQGVVKAEWNKRRATIEQTIQLYNLPYFTLQNVSGDIEAPVAELARLAQLQS